MGDSRAAAVTLEEQVAAEGGLDAASFSWSRDVAAGALTMAR